MMASKRGGEMKNWKRFNMRESKTATLYKPKPKLLQY